MTAARQQPIRENTPTAVGCHNCGRELFDGLTITCRCVKVRPDGYVMGKCKWCKCFNKLPLRLDHD